MLKYEPHNSRQCLWDSPNKPDELHNDSGSENQNLCNHTLRSFRNRGVEIYMNVFRKCIFISCNMVQKSHVRASAG